MIYSLEKYKQNLRIWNGQIYSYNKKVAVVSEKDATVYVLGWWSKTTTRHINYVANLIGYKTKPAPENLNIENWNPYSSGI